MKLLFDENISFRLVEILATDFPESTHIELLNMRGQSNTSIWDYAKQNSFILVSKDNDFRQKSFLYGHPPKAIWLSVGNARTMEIANLLKNNSKLIESFLNNTEESLLALELKENEE